MTIGKWGGGAVVAGVALATTEYVKDRMRHELDSRIGKAGEADKPAAVEPEKDGA